MLVYLAIASILVFACQAFIPFQNRTWPTRVYMGEPAFPSYARMEELTKEIDGTYLAGHQEQFLNASLMHNLRVWKTPAMIVYPVNSQDIAKVVTFAKKYNLHLCIRSSGHSYIGRSTHDGSVIIDMSAMKDIDINLQSSRHTPGEVKVQSGASWIEVYDKVNTVQGPGPTGDKVGRVVVGGSAHTVAMGGYTQGGGHAPICRKFGLAVDNLLEATIVTVDGKVLTLTADKTVTQELDGSTKESVDTSLFWAIRGGGGGTWGVVVSFTYKLHYAPARFRNLVLYYPMFNRDGSRVYYDNVKTALNLISDMSVDWGGYIVTSAAPVPNTPYIGLIVIFINHYGSDSSPSNKEGDELVAKSKPIYKTDTNYATFLGYEVNAKDLLVYNTYIVNTFIQPNSINDNNTLDDLTGFLYGVVKDGQSCTFAMIGGKVIESHHRPETPVHPGFRSGTFSASCGVGWDYDPMQDVKHIREALDMGDKLYKYGDGSYFNEPAADMPDWKTRFWADSKTYDRLLDIKKQYDPENYLWCHNCVGSDLSANYTPAVSYPPPY